MQLVIDHTIKTVEFKGASIQVVQLHLRSLDVRKLEAGFKQTLGGSPDFFDGELAVADLDAVEGGPREPKWARIRALCAEHGLHLVAVANAGEFADGARAADLAVLSMLRAPPPRPPPQRVSNEPAKREPPADHSTAARGASLLIERPLRSGQQVYGRGCDVVLLALASAGSEVIADGNIHAYAPLRGRALAGAQGNVDARIITTCFEPELVSIAGIYQTFDDGIAEALVRRPVQVRLLSRDVGEPALIIEPLAIG
jgi:septum site-determining protein MinC